MTDTLPEVSLFRLYLLRATYLLLVVGLALVVWPTLIWHEGVWRHWSGVGRSLLGAIPVLAVLGLWRPLKMLPLLLFELAWKVIWLSLVALPMWLSGRMDADTLSSVWECLPVVAFLVIIPWRYTLAAYVTGPGERWR